jgi:hypothetical protein
VEVRYDEGLATHIGPEPCAVVREVIGEASAGECIGQPLSREIGRPGDTPTAAARSKTAPPLLREVTPPGQALSNLAYAIL